MVSTSQRVPYAMADLKELLILDFRASLVRPDESHQMVT